MILLIIQLDMCIVYICLSCGCKLRYQWIHMCVFLCSSGLLHGKRGNRAIPPMPVTYHWRVWLNTKVTTWHQPPPPPPPPHPHPNLPPPPPPAKKGKKLQIKNKHYINILLTNYILKCFLFLTQFFSMYIFTPRAHTSNRLNWSYDLCLLWKAQ